MGGRPERFGVAVLIPLRLVFANPDVTWNIGDVIVDSAVEDTLMLLIFGWLAVKSNRWWPFVVTATTALTLLVHFLSIVTDISWDAAVSARVGLALLMYVAMLGGVAERWLAGEASICWTRLGEGRTPDR